MKHGECFRLESDAVAVLDRSLDQNVMWVPTGAVVTVDREDEIEPGFLHVLWGVTRLMMFRADLEKQGTRVEVAHSASAG